MQMLSGGMKRRLSASIILTVAAMILAFTVFGSLILAASLKNGVDSTNKRMGADMMIVPEGYKESAEAVLLTGSRNYFYFDRKVLDEVREIDGINAATSQFFLAGLSEKCCTDKVGIVGFDPETDFIIGPWIEEAYNGEIPDNEAVVGSDIILEEDGTIKLFDRKYKVAARLARTATSIDSSVYFTYGTIPALLKDAQEKSLNFLEVQKNENSISTVFVKLKSGQTELEVTKAIYESCGENIEIVYPKNIVQSLSVNLSGVVLGIKAFAGVVAAISVIVLFIIYLLSAGGRKREFALLRTVGCTRRRIVRLMVWEAGMLALAGGMAGSALAAVVVFPFGRYIGSILHMPYLCPDFRTVMIFLVFNIFIVVLTGVAASIYPAVRVSGIDPYSALREGE